MVVCWGDLDRQSMTACGCLENLRLIRNTGVHVAVKLIRKHAWHVDQISHAMNHAVWSCFIYHQNGGCLLGPVFFPRCALWPCSGLEKMEWDSGFASNFLAVSRIDSRSDFCRLLSDVLSRSLSLNSMIRCRSLSLSGCCESLL